MKIKKQWLVLFNGYLIKLIKTKNGYFIEEQTNLISYIPIMTNIAREYINITKDNYGFYKNISK
jgi:hypothetical protein